MNWKLTHTKAKRQILAKFMERNNTGESTLTWTDILHNYSLQSKML